MEEEAGVVFIDSNLRQVIDVAIPYLIREINQALNNPVTDNFVISGNIARLESGHAVPNIGDLQSKVVLTLVNIEEEKTLKNAPNYIKENQKVRNISPVVSLNLYLLFSCAHESYDTALTKISRIIGFFQKKNTYSASSHAVPFPAGLEKLILDLHTMNFEQMNHLWGVMGGKYHPSVLYKMRLLQIQETTPTDGDTVENIRSKVLGISRPDPIPGQLDW